MKKNRQIESEFLSQIRTHQGILQKICFVYAGTNVDKEDLYQEIILQLWKSFPSYRGEAEFSTWMYRVALNTAIAFSKRTSFFNNPLELKDETGGNDPGPDTSEDIEILHRAISRLKKIEKALILLWLEEKSYEEIADTLGISVKNVSVKLVRVKGKLGEIIKKLS